jgi:hypothetical protein
MTYKAITPRIASWIIDTVIPWDSSVFTSVILISIDRFRHNGH